MLRKKFYAVLFSIIMLLNMSSVVSSIEAINDDGGLTTTSFIPMSMNDAVSIPGDINTHAIIAPDERVIVTDTFDFPYSAIARMSTRLTCGCSGVGNGFMVSKNCLLTAGHVIKCSDPDHSDGVLYEVTLQFGYDYSDRTAVVTYEADEDNAYFWYDPNYANSYNSIYDYGYIVFDEYVGNHTGWLSITTKSNTVLNNSTVSVVGYKSGKMYSGTGDVISCSTTKIYYDTDTENGQSGAPIFITSSSGVQVVGIHTNGCDPEDNPLTGNSGWRFSAAFIYGLADLGYVQLT